MRFRDRLQNDLLVDTLDREPWELGARVSLLQDPLEPAIIVGTADQTEHEEARIHSGSKAFSRSV